ncbi:hypothetical protein ACF0H5_013091 [Mactra antiquata]
MTRISGVSGGNIVKFALCFLILSIVTYVFTQSYLKGPSVQEKSFQLVSTRDYQSNVPEIDLSQIRANDSVDMVGELKSKYGAITYKGIHQRSTTLTPEEQKLYEICVKNAQHDREHNGSAFWPKEQIRRTHHTYLKKKDSVMFEIGGNKGNDASEFVRLYNPRYLILEPLEEYANILKNKFKDNPKVTVINLGLGVKNEIAMVNIEGNNACATSKFSGKNGNTPLFVTNTTEFLLKAGVGMFDVDLMSMNCEGCEFEALETLLSTNIVEHFKNIQFATHSTIPGLKDPFPRYCKIQSLLARTHRPTYQYKLIWESWRRKDVE